MNARLLKSALEEIAGRGIPEDMNIMPALSARLEQPRPVWKFAAQPFVVIIIALSMFAFIAFGVYALGIVRGYLPGLGVVDVNAPFYMLSEPVSQTREGVSVTIKEGLLNTDQMRLVIRIQGVQPENQSFLALPDSKACEARPELRYSDGKKIISREGKVKEFEDGYESEIKFTRVPPDGTEATLFIPCLFGSAESGIPPENWSIPFRLFLPPEGTDFDVILLPTQTPLPIPPEPESLPTMPAPSTTTAQLNPISVLEIIDTGTSYVFIGAFAPPASAAGETSIYAISDYLLRDASDRTIEWRPATGLDLTPYILSAPGKDVWAIEFTRDFVPPLQITYQTQRLVSPDKDEQVSFEFDAGENPQAGQEWKLDREIELAGHKVTLTEITAGASSYTFHFQTNDDLVESVGMHDQNAIRIEGYRHENFAGRFGIGSWSLTKIYAQMPRGKLTISVSGIFLFGEIEDWTIAWRPQVN